MSIVLKCLSLAVLAGNLNEDVFVGSRVALVEVHLFSVTVLLSVSTSLLVS